MEMCLTEFQLFDLAMKSAVQFVYEFKVFAGMVDPNGLSLGFEYLPDQGCYFTDDIPVPEEDS